MVPVLSATQASEGTEPAAVQVAGGGKGYGGVEYLLHGFFQQRQERCGACVDIVDAFLSEVEYGVGRRVLDEEQRRTHGQPCGIVAFRPAHEYGIEYGLQIVVVVAWQVLRAEDSLHVGQWRRPVAARLVVYYSYAVLSLAIGAGLRDAVKPVYPPTYGSAYRAVGRLDIDGCHHVAFQSDDGEWGELLVLCEQQSQIVNDDLAVDELQSVELGHVCHVLLSVAQLEELLAYGLVHGTLYVDLLSQQAFYVGGENLSAQ